MEMKVYSQTLRADEGAKCAKCKGQIKKASEYYRTIPSTSSGNRLSICIECGDQLLAADKANEGSNDGQ
jgi:uncharacterized protein with PIN domain